MPWEIKYTSNHPEWYMKKAIQGISGNSFINYAQVNGNLAGLPGAALPTTPSGVFGYNSVSTAMRLQMIDLLPGSSESTVFDSMTELWTNTRMENVSTATPPYSAQAVQAVTYWFSEAIKLLAFSERIYHTINYFPVEDSTMPYVLAAAMNIDYDAFAADIANLKNNILLYKDFLQSKIFIPLSIFERKAWLYGHVFADYNGDKASYYVPVPQDICYPKAAQSLQLDGFVQLCPKEVGPTTTTTGSITPAIIYDIMDKFRTSPVWTMNGVIAFVQESKRAFGADPVSKLSTIENGAKQVMAYDEYALTQIQNGLFWDYPIKRNRSSILGGFYMDKPTIDVRDNTFYAYFKAVCDNPLVNGWGDAQRSYGRQISLTRLCPIVEFKDTQANEASVLYAGTEIGGQARAFFTNTESDLYHKLQFTDLGIAEVTEDISSATAGVIGIKSQTWAQFDYAPRCLLLGKSESFAGLNGTYLDLFDYSDFGYYYKTNASTIERIANWSLVYAPCKKKEDKYSKKDKKKKSNEGEGKGADPNKK